MAIATTHYISLTERDFMKKYESITTGETHKFETWIRGLEEADRATTAEWIHNEAKKSAIVFTGALNDDTIYQLADGETYLLEVYHYANEWGNTLVFHMFESLDEALNFYEENYKSRVEAEGKRSIQEWEESGECMDWANPVEEWEDLIYTCIAG